MIVRECEEADPIIIARYSNEYLLLFQVTYINSGFGVEKKAHTANLNDKDIEGKLIILS